MSSLLLLLFIGNAIGLRLFEDTFREQPEELLKDVIFTKNDVKNNYEETVTVTPISAWNHTKLPCMTPLFYFTSRLVGTYYRPKLYEYWCSAEKFYMFTFSDRRANFKAGISNYLPKGIMVGGLIKKNDKWIKYLRFLNSDKETLNLGDCHAPSYTLSIYIYESDYYPRTIWGRESAI